MIMIFLIVERKIDDEFFISIQEKENVCEFSILERINKNEARRFKQ